jgi:CHAD domain-containing protein
MAPTKKWLNQISPGASFTEAARIGLRDRLTNVARLMPMAANQADQDIEHVHALRVATRRAQAAATIFSAAMARRRRKRIMRFLCEIRRSAGPARDLDVMIDRLEHAHPDLSAEHLHDVIIKLKEQRAAAQPEIQRAFGHFHRRFRRQSEKVITRIRWRGKGPERSFGDAARHELNRFAVKFDAVGTPLAALGDLDHHLQDLHRLRIRSKRLRYAMELSVGVVGSELRELYSFLAETQQRLGAINDHAVAVDFLKRWQEHELPATTIVTIDGLIDFEITGLRRLVEAFPERWNPQQLAAFWASWNDIVGGLRFDRIGA